MVTQGHMDVIPTLVLQRIFTDAVGSGETTQGRGPSIQWLLSLKDVCVKLCGGGARGGGGGEEEEEKAYRDRKKLRRDRGCHIEMETKEKEPCGDRKRPCGDLMETEATWRRKQKRVVPLPAKDSKDLWQQQKLEEKWEGTFLRTLCWGK